MYPADFLAKWGPKVGADRGDMAGDLGSVVHDRFDKLRAALERAIELLEDGQPPKGGRTDQFVKKAKKLLRG